MSLAEFNAAGALGRRAADAVGSLHALPGFVGISLQAGKILVEGSGTALQARVTSLQTLLTDIAALPAYVAPTPAPSINPALL
jgi:hypothetical protein